MNNLLSNSSIIFSFSTWKNMEKNTWKKNRFYFFNLIFFHKINNVSRLSQWTDLNFNLKNFNVTFP